MTARENRLVYARNYIVLVRRDGVHDYAIKTVAVKGIKNCTPRVLIIHKPHDRDTLLRLSLYSVVIQKIRCDSSAVRRVRGFIRLRSFDRCPINVRVIILRDRYHESILFSTFLTCVGAHTRNIGAIIMSSFSPIPKLLLYFYSNK